LLNRRRTRIGDDGIQTIWDGGGEKKRSMCKKQEKKLQQEKRGRARYQLPQIRKTVLQNRPTKIEGLKKGDEEKGR